MQNPTYESRTTLEIVAEISGPYREAGTTERVRHDIATLSASLRKVVDQPIWIVRTWSATDLTNRLHIGITADPGRSNYLRQFLLSTCKANDTEVSVQEYSHDDAPSPLWNSGFKGQRYDRVTKDVAARTTPIVANVAGQMLKEPSGAYSLALHMMVSHAASSLLRSRQRDYEHFSFEKLLRLRLLSFRSHVEGFLAQVKDREKTEDIFEQYVELLSDPVRKHIGALIDHGRRHEDKRIIGSDLLAGWSNVIEDSIPTIREIVQSGGITSDPPSSTYFDENGEDLVAPSDFHAFLTPALEELLFRDADFMAYRILTSHLYSSLYTLGFTLTERCMLCYIIARANEEVFEKSVVELKEELMQLADEIVEVKKDYD